MKVSGQHHDPAAYLRWKNRRYSLDRRLGGPKSQSGRGGEKKKILSLSLPGIEPRPSST
jgi:hypothetical protein